MASREARSLGLVLICESTVTPVPIPRTNVPARRACETLDGSLAPVGWLFLVLVEGEGGASENGLRKEKKGGG